MIDIHVLGYVCISKLIQSFTFNHGYSSRNEQLSYTLTQLEPF